VAEPAITVRGLRKSYGALEAVRGLDLHVDRGEVFSLLGPNGAGKTTTVEILEGHRKRSAGEVAVLGHDPGAGERALKERIGIVLQSPSVQPYLTVEETVALYRGYYPHPRPLDEILEVVGLAEQRGSRVRRLSGGQQRRLDVAIGLAGDPELLFLDEPTTGFDPSARRQAWEMVKSLQALGKTIFLTTHYMDEAQYLADRVTIMSRGQAVAEGSPRDLVGRVRGARIAFRAGADAPALIAGVDGAQVDAAGRVTIQSEEPTRLLHDLTGRALERGVALEDLTVTRASLEDVYLELTGGDAAANDAPAEAPAAGGRSRRRRGRRGSAGAGS
jgi:ABC-2 type transport system ATP-binding protein